MNTLPFIEVDPDSTHTHTIICLHGLGANGADLAPLAKELNLPGVRWIFPDAPERAITINNGMVMRAWHDRGNFASAIPTSDELDLKGVDESDKQIQQLIELESQKVAHEEIFLMGFSQGGAMAIYTGIHFPKKLAGIMGLSAYPAKADKTFEDLSEANQKTQIFIAHGSHDDIVAPQLGQALFNNLKADSYNVTWHEYPMAHSICLEELEDLQVWYSSVI